MSSRVQLSSPAGLIAGSLRWSQRASRPRSSAAYTRNMTLLRMDNVLVVVEDLQAAIAFFADIGMELEGEATVEGPWIDRIVGFDGSKCDIAMMRTPDGHGRVELEKYHAPSAIRGEPEDAPVNTLGLRRIMFAVDDIDAVLERL